MNTNNRFAALDANYQTPVSSPAKPPSAPTKSAVTKTAVKPSPIAWDSESKSNPKSGSKSKPTGKQLRESFRRKNEILFNKISAIVETAKEPLQEGVVVDIGKSMCTTADEFRNLSIAVHGGPKSDEEPTGFKLGIWGKSEHPFIAYQREMATKGVKIVSFTDLASSNKLILLAASIPSDEILKACTQIGTGRASGGKKSKCIETPTSVSDGPSFFEPKPVNWPRPK